MFWFHGFHIFSEFLVLTVENITIEIEKFGKSQLTLT